MIDKLKTIFKDKELLKQSLTHKSWGNENKGKRKSNERLEFLGDAVLEFVVTRYLFDKFPDKEEGYLTNLRANIVNTRNLSNFARKIELGPEIFLAKGEKQTKGHENSSLLADTVEAVIGAIYLDQGIKIAKEFILENLLSDIEEKIQGPLKDPKSRLQEHLQSKKIPAPKYKVIKAVGPDNAKEFTIDVLVEGKVMGQGVGRTKQEAQQKAASLALEKLID